MPGAEAAPFVRFLNEFRVRKGHRRSRERRYSGPGWRVSGEIFANQGLASPTSDEVKRCRGCPKDAIISQMACGSTLPTHGYFLRVSASGGSGRASNKRGSRLVSGEIRLMRKFDSKRCLQIRLLRAIWHAALAVAALAARAACVVVAAIGTPAPSMIGKRKDTR
jgi:hypothetical protein